MIISGNTAYNADENGNLIEEPYEPESGCVWKDMGMCRGCPVCQYPEEEDYEDYDDDEEEEETMREEKTLASYYEEKALNVPDDDYLIPEPGTVEFDCDQA